MNAVPIRLLLLEDNPGDARLVQTTLADEAPGEFAITTVERLADALARIQTERFDVVLCDLGLPDSTGLDTAQAIVAGHPALPLVVLTGSHNEDLGRAAIVLGAQDYLVKGETRASTIARTLRYAIERKCLENKLHEAKETLERRVAERTAELATANTMLRESEGKLRAIFDGALDGILVVDLKAGKFLTGNPEICRMLGYTLEEIVRLGVPDIHPKQDLPRVIEQFERQTRGEIRLTTDTPVKRKDGSVFYADIRAAQVRIGGADCLLGIFRDVTERKHGEEALRAAEEQFRGMVEQSIAGIYIIQDGKFAYVNPRFAEIRGYAGADELIGRDPTPLIAEKDRDAVAENNRRLLAGEAKNISYSFTALRKDASEVEVGVSSTYASYRDQPAIIGMMQDISEKKRADEQIQRYIEQLRVAFMSTVDVATTLSEMRDPYTTGHERRVAKIAVAIGADLGLDAHRQEGLRVAGHLHDIGKINVPAEILSKPGKLSPIQFQLIQGHAQAGYDVLKDVGFPWPVAEVALQHHERIDGSGYPQGLKGEAIVLEARIMAVADVVEAMSSHRPYRPGLGIEAALTEIERGRGTVYDPQVADACLKLFREKGYTIPS